MHQEAKMSACKHCFIDCGFKTALKLLKRLKKEYSNFRQTDADLLALVNVHHKLQSKVFSEHNWPTRGKIFKQRNIICTARLGWKYCPVNQEITTGTNSLALVAVMIWSRPLVHYKVHCNEWRRTWLLDFPCKQSCLPLDKFLYDITGLK